MSGAFPLYPFILALSLFPFAAAAARRMRGGSAGNQEERRMGGECERVTDYVRERMREGVWEGGYVKWLGMMVNREDSF